MEDRQILRRDRSVRQQEKFMHRVDFLESPSRMPSVSAATARRATGPGQPVHKDSTGCTPAEGPDRPGAGAFESVRPAPELPLPGVAKTAMESGPWYRDPRMTPTEEQACSLLAFDGSA